MKQLVFILLSLLLLSSCFSKEKQNSDAKTLEEALILAGNSLNSKDSLFLGFNFGMDSCDTYHKIDSLVKIGKLSYRDGYLRYDFNIAPLHYNPAVGFVFKNDTLSKISLAFLNEERHPVELIKNAVSAHIFETLTAKGYKSYKEKNLLESEDYYFIKDNISISLKAYERLVVMSYSNAIVYMKEKQEHIKKQKLQTKQTLSDL